MSKAYRIPDTPRHSTTPAQVAEGKVKTLPIMRMPVRSFIIRPDGSNKIPLGLSVVVEGIAFSGHGGIVKVEISDDEGDTWKPATPGEDHGPYAFRTYRAEWKPTRAGRIPLMCRATDEKGNVQQDLPVWNPGGYLWNRIEQQMVVVAKI